jgi:hypothetical protein
MYQTLTNRKKLFVYQPTVPLPAASATGFLQHYLEFELFKIECQLFTYYSGKCYFKMSAEKGNQKKIRGKNIGIQSNDGILSSYERGDELLILGIISE